MEETVYQREIRRPHEVAIVRKLTAWQFQVREIAKVLTVSQARVSECQRRLGIVRRVPPVEFADPNPLEIRQRAEAIRQAWSPSVAERRKVGAGDAWTPMMVPSQILAIASD